MKTVLLIDGDTIAFKYGVSFMTTKTNEDGTTYKELFVPTYAAACGYIDNFLDELKCRLFADEIEVILSDPARNFRKEVYPPYKMHRDNGSRPILIDELKDYLRANYRGFHWPGLEADDVQGIIATGDPSGNTNYIVVSIDKDLKQIPGKLYNPDKPDLGVMEITPEAGMFWTWEQTITGDSTDGYPGIPGVGAVGAKGALNKAIARGVSVFDLWPVVLQYYHGKGHTTEYALSQLRCARILQNSDYDLLEEKVTLWTPPGHPEE